ncbi:MAG: DUF948 domain-containing protein [Cyanobacteriota bacterium]
MLNAWSVLALVLSVGFAFLFFYVVKLVMQLINTVKTLEDTVKNIEKNITPIIENFDGITGKVEDITNRADLIIGVVEAKTEETTQIIQKVRVNLDIIRHSLYIFVIQIFKYFKILSKDVNVSKNESVDSDTKKNDTNSSKVRIVDHLEKVKYN